MSREIQTITEKNRFDGIINKYFQSNSLFYKSQSGNIQVKYLGISNGMAEIKFPNSIGVPDECVLFTSKDETVVISYMAKKGQKSEEIALYNPSSFQIVSSSRIEMRRDVTRDKNSLLYARNMISEQRVHHSLKKNHEKIEKIKMFTMQNEIDSQNLFKIKILSEFKDDSRINFFEKFKRPLFISSRFTDVNDSRNVDIKYYLNHIYSKDNDLINKSSIISEISVPIIYQEKVILGYIQVNSSSVLSLSSLHNYKRLAMIIENKIIENKIIEEEENSFLISDISPEGVSIVYRENDNKNIFMKEGLAYFDIMLPFRQKVSLVSEVMHIIQMPNDVKKIGLKIVEIDNQGEKFLTKYLNDLVL